MGRVEKSFSDLDIGSVDLDSGSWTWSRGGHPLSDDEYAISYIADDECLTETRYKLPDFLNKMLALQERYGAEDAKRKIRMALSI